MRHWAVLHTLQTKLEVCILLVILACVIVLSSATVGAVEPTKQGDVVVNAEVPASEAIKPATIRTPSSKTSTTKSTIIIRGDCEPRALVVVYVNKVMAGSTHCTTNGTYQITVQLRIGKNEIYVRNYDDLGRMGQPTPGILITYTPAKPAPVDHGNPNIPPREPEVPQKPIACSAYTPNSVTEGGEPRVVAVCMPSFIEPDKEYVLGVVISGGKAPYALSVEWGDGKQPHSLYSFDTVGYHAIPFKYESPGAYVATIRTADQTGYAAFSQVAILVDGGLVGPTNAFDEVRENVSWLYATTPTFVALFALLVGFWIGFLLHRHSRDHPASHDKTQAKG